MKMQRSFKQYNSMSHLTSYTTDVIHLFIVLCSQSLKIFCRHSRQHPHVNMANVNIDLVETRVNVYTIQMKLTIYI